MVGFGGMMGKMGSGATNELLSRLGIEVGKMSAEFERTPLLLNNLVQAFKELSSQSNLGPFVGEGRTGGVTVGGPTGGGPGGPSQGPLDGASSFRKGAITGLAVRLSYIAVLKAAIDTAAEAGKTFNLETAINDLWVHLESVKRLASGTTVKGDSGNIDIETGKLKRLIDKRAQMFDILKKIVDSYNETAKNMTSNMAR
jgi:hypothetical protein